MPGKRLGSGSQSSSCGELKGLCAWGVVRDQHGPSWARRAPKGLSGLGVMGSVGFKMTTGCVTYGRAGAWGTVRAA